MPATVVFGAQWGDEGKGRAVDYLAGRYDIVARYNGGNNAGHTVINELGTFKMHLVPCGVFYPKTLNLMGGGMIVDPAVLLEELAELQKAGLDFGDRLYVSPRIHLIMPYHRILDGLYEAAKGKGATGTTRRGIGPCFADKVSYNGLRWSDVADADLFAEKLGVQLSLKNKIMAALGGEALDFNEVYATYRGYYEQLRPYIRETTGIVQEALSTGKRMLLEQANGTLLDTDWGTYPFVTASSTLASVVTPGLGVPPGKLDQIIGIAKAYTTRVGAGPMPTEILDPAENAARQALTEIAVTTGRTRRAAWLDLEILKFALYVNGATDIFLTKLDVLSSFEQIKVGVGYELDGKPVRYYDLDSYALAKVKPVYRILPGWQSDISAVRRYADLPEAARNYVETIEQVTGVHVSWISVGPERDALIGR
ncbi:MAG: adenylosuccinate synthase [Chloroflexota bacterium]